MSRSQRAAAYAAALFLLHNAAWLCYNSGQMNGEGVRDMSRTEFETILQEVRAGRPAELIREIDGVRYVRRFEPAERLILLGGGHVALQLCKMAAMLDFRITVVDDRPSFANSERFPEAEYVLCDSFSYAIARLAPNENDYVCVITRGHRWDDECLRAILRAALPKYLGLLGSKRRVEGLLRHLAEEGFAQDALAKIHAPIGLPINAITTAEIAVSVCAELVACRRARGKRELDGALVQTNTDESALQALASGDTPHAMLLVLQTKGATPVKSGAVMSMDRLGQGSGTIGGGCSEAAAMQKARSIIGTGRSELFSVDLTADMAAEEGMVCGGKMTVLIEDVT